MMFKADDWFIKFAKLNSWDLSLIVCLPLNLKNFSRVFAFSVSCDCYLRSASELTHYVRYEFWESNAAVKRTA